MKKKTKSFLPHENYRPMAYGVFSILIGILAFGFIYLGQGFKTIEYFGYFLFVVAFLSAIFYYLKFMWVVFIKGGWRKEHEEFLKELEPKQPWE